MPWMVRAGEAGDRARPLRFTILALSLTLFASVTARAQLSPLPQVLAGRCAIEQGGALRCWDGRPGVPAGSFKTIHEHGGSYCGVRVDGSAACWGGQVAGRAQAQPQGRFTDVWPMSNTAFCGLRDEGTIECWAVPLMGPNERRALDTFPGRFVKIVLNYNYWRLLDVDGHVHHRRISTANPNVTLPPESADRFLDIGQTPSAFYSLRADGLVNPIANATLDSPQHRGGPYIAVSPPCQLRADGQVDCASGQERLRRRGPFVQMDGMCGVTPEGRVEGAPGVSCNGSPADLAVAVPDALKIRVAPRPPLVELLAARARGREQEGTPTSYRVVLRNHEGNYLAVDRTGALLTAAMRADNGMRGHIAESDLVLVDINGGKLEHDDPIYLKRGAHYVVANASTHGSLGTQNKPGPDARWTLHTTAIEREAAGAPEASTVFDPRIGAHGLLLRNAGGMFLTPCTNRNGICDETADGDGVEHAGARPGRGPWLLRDPFFEASNAEPIGHGVEWQLWPVIDCNFTDPTNVRRYKRGPCSVEPARAGALLDHPVDAAALTP